MNYLGIDYGKKKIGIAIAPDGILAVGLLTLKNSKNILTELRRIIEENSVKIIVVGLPLSMNGDYSPATKTTLNFISKVRREFPDGKVFSYDERLTSQEAKRNLPPRAPDDSESARIILQGFLDSQKLS